MNTQSSGSLVTQRASPGWAPFTPFSLNDLDLVVVLQTTQRTAKSFTKLRKALTDLILEIRRTVQRPRMGLVCFKDHQKDCAKAEYLTLEHPLSSNLISVVNFLTQPKVAPALGRDGAQALECGLNVAQQFQWRKNAYKVTLVIGDKPPHGGGLDSFGCCPSNNDYRDEVEAFRRRGVKLYTVSMGDLMETRRVFEWMAAETEGVYWQLEQPEDLTPLFMGFTHRECGGLGRYSRRLKDRGHMTDRFKRILTALSA